MARSNGLFFKRKFLIGGILAALTPVSALGHDPVFGLGPHVLFKGGIEIAPHFEQEEAGSERGRETTLELTYGLTGDWAAGLDVGYKNSRDDATSDSGVGDVRFFTKYRFWRKDSPGLQQSASVLLALKPDTGEDGIGTGSTDGVVGLTYGYEGRKWYRWASARYRVNGETDAGLRRGNRLFLDLVGGIRLKLTGYREPDTVWLLELNGEFTDRAELNGAALANTGGTAWFVSPGIFWTKRNFAIKAGAQIPIYSDLNGTQEDTDYRAKLVLEWHL